MKLLLVRAMLALLVAAVPAVAASATDAEQRSLNELRNTVVNLLQGLVERGVLTREQAESMVAEAQAKAAEDAAAQAAQEQAESGAVRVPYVPQIVRDEIRRQVVEDLTGEVTKEVVETAKSEYWGIPAALPEWVQRLRLSGDMRVRSQLDLFAEDNARFAYADFLTVNDRGGLGRAGAAAYSNVSQDRQRLRARLRLGLDAELGYGWTLGARLATGSLRDPVSANQTLGNTGARYQTGLDLAYARWSGNSDDGDHALNFWAGRMPNPWYATDLVWDSDLTFEGIAASYRYGPGRLDPSTHFVYATLGAFPIEEVELSDKDKWLVGAQVGVDWTLPRGDRLRLGASYYDFRNVTGVRNNFDDATSDFTAPRILRRGNTLFDIRNDADPTTNLFALAAEYRLVNVTAAWDWRLSETHRVTLSGDWVRNVGYDRTDVLARRAASDPVLGAPVLDGDTGYQFEVGFGTAQLMKRGGWRAFMGYRYLEADAVLDVFTDSEFRLGGTDVEGFYVGANYAFTPKVFARLRYLSGNEIDYPDLGIDVIQLDLNTQF